jgi:hypothetical protein
MMPFRAVCSRAMVLALALPGLFASTAAAQKAGDKDLKEISAYTWTMPKFKQLMTAIANLGKAAKDDPKMGGALGDAGNLTIDQAAARYGAVPPVKRALADAGMSPREFAVAQGAWLQSAMSYGVMKQYKLTADSVSKTTGVSKANLEFFRANEAEIDRMGKELQAQMPKEASENGEANGEEAGEEAADSTE